MKGNFWHRYGFSKNGCNYLHPEEALMLVERGQVYIEDDGGSPVPSSVFYEMMISEISLPVYLAFLKLRVRVSISLLHYVLIRSVHAGFRVHNTEERTGGPRVDGRGIAYRFSILFSQCIYCCLIPSGLTACRDRQIGCR